jgi:hypothetical protein
LINWNNKLSISDVDMHILEEDEEELTLGQKMEAMTGMQRRDTIKACDENRGK